MKQPHWPERWDFRKGAIYYRPRPSERDRFEGKYYYRLGKDETEAFETWARLHPRIVPRRIREGIALYKTTRRWSRLADKTRKEYGKSLTRIDAVFGHMAPSDLLPTDVYAYLDERPQVAGKRDVAALSNVMAECVRAGACQHNPCIDVRYEKEEPRDRYVSDEEIEAFADFTEDAELQARIAILWATGSRPGQVRQLTLFAWDGEGLTIDGAKRGKSVRYTGPVLKATIARLLESRKGKRAKSEFLFPNRSGKMYTDDGWRTGWQRQMKDWGELGNRRFQERDIRAKVVSDEESIVQASERAGHQQMSTTKRVYRRKTVNVVELGSTALRKYATSGESDDS
jgi:integrase